MCTKFQTLLQMLEIYINKHSRQKPHHGQTSNLEEMEEQTVHKTLTEM
jgi:hypothetical protein